MMSVIYNGKGRGRGDGQREFRQQREQGTFGRGKNSFWRTRGHGERRKGQSWREKGPAVVRGLKRRHADETFVRPGLAPRAAREVARRDES